MVWWGEGEGEGKSVKWTQPAALLAESLSQPGSDDGRGLGVELADLMAPVVVLGMGEVGVAPLGLAPGRVRGPWLGRPGPPIKPVNELVLGRREVRPATQVKPESGHKVHGPRHGLFALRDQQVPSSASCSAVNGVVEGEQLVGMVGRRAGRWVGAWVEERVVELGMGLLRWIEVRESGGRGLRVEAAVNVEGLGVGVEDLAGLVRVGGSFFLARQHHRARVPPSVVQHFAFPASNGVVSETQSQTVKIVSAFGRDDDD